MELHNYGLIRFSKRTGKIDTTLTALGKGMIQLWAMQNTPKSKACVIVDIDKSKAVAEYIGTEDGFPEIHKSLDDFEFNVPDELYVFLKEKIKDNDTSLVSKITAASKRQSNSIENLGDKDIEPSR